MSQRPGGGKRQRLSHYEMHEQIGAGGMGAVYRALDRRSGVAVAVKVVHPHLQVDTAYIDRFRREAHIASLLSSPYVVRILDFGLDKGQYFMVTEFVTGTKLTDILRQGRLDPLQALAITAQVTLALDEAEGRGVVHRDIKPDNIIITPDNSVKVLDFGIARQAGMPGVTMTGIFVGTLQYSAPEQFGGHADIRSDMYALGVTLFYMLAGELPFSAPTPTGLMRLVEDAPPPLEKLGGLPGPVVDLVAKMLAKSPNDRYQHVSQLLAAIEGARQSITGARTDSWMADATSVIARARDEAPEPTHAAPPPREQTPSEVTQLQSGAAPAPRTGGTDVTEVQRADTGATQVQPSSADVTEVQTGARDVTQAAPGFDDVARQQTAAHAGPAAASGAGAPPSAFPPATREAGGGGRNRLLLLIAGVAAVAVVGVILAVVAFGGGGDGDDGDDGRGGSDRPTPRATRTPTPDDEPTPVSDAEFDAAAAAAAPAALLNLDDFGEGWTSGPQMIPDRDFQNISGPCQPLVEQDFPGQAVFLESDEYTGPDGLGSRSDVAVFRTLFDSEDAIDAIDQAAHEPCYEELAPELERILLQEANDAGFGLTAVEVTIEEIDVIALGDYSDGTRFTITSRNDAASATFVSEVITMRVGHLIANFYYEGGEPDEAARDNIAESVARRMQDVDESLP